LNGSSMICIHLSTTLPKAASFFNKNISNSSHKSFLHVPTDHTNSIICRAVPQKATQPFLILYYPCRQKSSPKCKVGEELLPLIWIPLHNSYPQPSSPRNLSNHLSLSSKRHGSSPSSLASCASHSYNVDDDV